MNDLFEIHGSMELAKAFQTCILESNHALIIEIQTKRRKDF